MVESPAVEHIGHTTTHKQADSAVRNQHDAFMTPLPCIQHFLR